MESSLDMIIKNGRLKSNNETYVIIYYKAHRDEMIVNGLLYQNIRYCSTVIENLMIQYCMKKHVIHYHFIFYNIVSNDIIKYYILRFNTIETVIIYITYEQIHLRSKFE